VLQQITDVLTRTKKMNSAAPTTAAAAAESGCYLLQQGTDVLTNMCKAISPGGLGRLSCTCRALCTIASSEEVWVQHCPQEWRHFGVIPCTAAPHLSTRECGSPEHRHISATSGSGNGMSASMQLQAYSTWRSLGISAHTAPTLQIMQMPAAEYRRQVGLLVAKGHFAHADLALCRGCMALANGALWVDLCVLLWHVFRDTSRAQRALWLAARFVAPCVASSAYPQQWDAECGHVDTPLDPTLCMPEHCNALNYSFLLSMASRVCRQEEGTGSNREWGMSEHALGFGGAIAHKVFGVTLRHNENARLECRKRAAWLLTLKIASPPSPPFPLLLPFLPPQQHQHQHDAPPPSSSPSSSCSSSSVDEDHDSEDATEMSVMELSCSVVAVACARHAHAPLRQCAKQVAVEWMRSAW